MAVKKSNTGEGGLIARDNKFSINFKPVNICLCV